MNPSTNGVSPLRRRGEDQGKEEDYSSMDRMRVISRRDALSAKGPSSPTSSYSSSSSQREWTSEQREMATLLKRCGVRFYAQLAKTYPAELIRGKVDEWAAEADLGPGMLVKMIQGGDPIVGRVEPIERPLASDARDDPVHWHRERYERGRGGYA